MGTGPDPSPGLHSCPSDPSQSHGFKYHLHTEHGLRFLCLRFLGNRPFSSTLAHPTCRPHLNVQYNSSNLRFPSSPPCSSYLLQLNQWQFLMTRPKAWELSLSACILLHSTSIPAKPGFPLSDSRIRPHLTTATATTSSLAPCPPDCLLTDYSSGLCHFSAPNPQWLLMSSEHNPEPYHAHQAPPGPTYATSLTLPSNHTRAHMQTLTLSCCPGSLLVHPQAMHAPIQGPLNLLFLLHCRPCSSPKYLHTPSLPSFQPLLKHCLIREAPSPHPLLCFVFLMKQAT